MSQNSPDPFHRLRHPSSACAFDVTSSLRIPPCSAVSESGISVSFISSLIRIQRYSHGRLRRWGDHYEKTTIPNNSGTSIVLYARRLNTYQRKIRVFCSLPYFFLEYVNHGTACFLFTSETNHASVPLIIPFRKAYASRFTFRKHGNIKHVKRHRMPFGQDKIAFWTPNCMTEGVNAHRCRGTSPPDLPNAAHRTKPD